MEHILTPKVENVKLLDKFNPKNSPLGTLYLTTTHLIFVSNSASAGAAATSGSVSATGVKEEVWLLHMLMHTVEKPTLTTSGTQLRVLCANFQSNSFIIQRDRDAHDVYMSLQALAKPRTHRELYAFSYNPKGELRQCTGWNFHDALAEFQRQGVPNENWSHCTLNAQYGMCPTYPQHLFVPACASQGLIEGSAKFRSKGRLPVLTYLHKNKAAILRCAQPLVGISGVRSSHDEMYVDCLRKATPGSSFIYVIDTRPAMNAFANRAGGKGYENEKYYENISFSFKGIENIHKIRNSLKAMVSSVTSTTSMEAFMSELGGSYWLKHLKAVLDASVSITQCVLEDKSVIVHCSDGWDRTAQTCALAQLMLDGYFRTLQGFQALIEKDWLSFGHKFTDRCGHLDGDPNEVSPTFTQFLDCVWQLTQLFPQAFQFNEKYLITIHEHVYSCQYGTFIGNCERERAELGLKESTYSLWGYLVANHDEFGNPLYDAESAQKPLKPNIVPQSIKFWSGLYCRFEKGAHPREPLVDLLSVTQNNTSSLEDHGRQLTKTIGQMTSLLSGATSVASGGMRKMMQPVATAGDPLGATTQPRESDLDKMERKFTDLKTSIVDKCQTSNLRTDDDDDREIEEAEDACVSNLTKCDVEDQLKVAVDWKPLRNCKECQCGTSLEGTATTKTHCRKCGQLFCRRCARQKIALPGHASGKEVPVCNACFKEMGNGNNGATAFNKEGKTMAEESF